MAQIHPSMQDLYERLRQVGIDQAFLRRAVLPSWWRDEMAAVPANRQLAELYLAQGLSLNPEDLESPNQALELRVGDVRFKRSRRADAEKSQPTAFIARQAGEMLAESLTWLSPYITPASRRPSEVRSWIFSHGHSQVDLGSLLEYCWAHGIIVFHLSSVAAAAHKLDGMVMFCDSRPAIMLGSHRRVHSWLAFHLAHELSHLMLGHVKPGEAPLVDSDLEISAGTDQIETEANRQALAILTQDFEPDVEMPADTLPTKLLFRMEDLAKEWRVDPGILILIHAQKHHRWKEAGKSLNLLFADPHPSAKELVNQALLSHVDRAELSETVQRFLTAVLAL